jgi:hypothetical protein
MAAFSRIHACSPELHPLLKAHAITRYWKMTGAEQKLVKKQLAEMQATEVADNKALVQAAKKEEKKKERGRKKRHAAKKASVPNKQTVKLIQ